MKSEKINKFLECKMDILEKDINEIVLNCKFLKELEKSSVLVTGSTGLIGSILVKTLLKNKNIKVYACYRNPDKFQSVFKNYFCDNFIPICSDILNLDISNLNIDYIVHGASITDSKTFVEKPVETLNIAIDGTRNILNQCINKNIKSFIYLSSLEVYGTFNSCDEIKNVTENDAGYINTMSVRSSYSEGKRIVENICSSYCSEYKIPIKVARLCQTFGAGVLYNDNRVFAQFARAIIENKNIILKTKGETVRNYCYTTDAISGIITVLVKGKVGEAYNIANMKTTISIVNMAKLLCSSFPNSKTKIIFELSGDATKLGYNPIVKLQLDSSKLESLGWNANVSLEEAYKRLIEYMRNSRENI